MGNNIDFDVVADLIEIKSPAELLSRRPLMSRPATPTIRSPWRWDMAAAVSRRSRRSWIQCVSAPVDRCRAFL